MATTKEANRGLRKHALLTAADRKTLVKQAELPEAPLFQKMVVTKFFCPYSSFGPWYAVEYDGEDTFYGLVRGHVDEWGSFSYAELQETTIRLYGTEVPAIERDCSFEPITVQELQLKMTLGEYV